LNLIQRVTTSRPETKVVESFCLSVTSRSAPLPHSVRPHRNERAGSHRSINPLHLSCRRRTANTSFTQSSNHMSLSSIISSRSRSRRRLTRSSGANGRILPTSCCPLTVRARQHVAPLLRKRSTGMLILDPLPDKTIKLWKVFEKSLRVVSESNHWDGQRNLPTPLSPMHLRLPKMTQQDNIIAAVPRKVYANAHAYHIHSISINSDQETYISADDLRINLWNLNISDQSFSEWCHVIDPISSYGVFIDIVDIKPVNMEELTEVITSSEFHPTHCNHFMYSSSKSNIKLADMRDAALCDRHAKSELFYSIHPSQGCVTSVSNV
jgi:hypothetical protein